jgi:HEAT repeat protein
MQGLLFALLSAPNGAAQIAPLLVRCFKNDGDVHVRSMAASVLCRIPEAFEALRDGLADPSPEIRCSVARALGRATHPAALGALHEALGDPELSVRVAVCESLTTLDPADRGLKEQLSELLEVARGENPKLHMGVYKALAAIGGAEANEALHSALRQEGAHAQISAMLALGHYPAVEFFPDIRPMLDGEWTFPDDGGQNSDARPSEQGADFRTVILEERFGCSLGDLQPVGGRRPARRCKIGRAGAH